MHQNKKTSGFLSCLQTGMVLVLWGFSQSLWADWALNPERSTVYFASVKADTAVEVHHFKSLDGRISAAGDAHLEIDLSGVNTNIAIRDERMKEHFFKVAQFPKAHVSVNLGEQGIEDGIRDVKAVLSLHGHEKELDASVNVVMDVDNNVLKVITARPIVLNTGDFGLLDGVEQLREMAGLSSIAPMVPVSFLLQFNEVTATDAPAETTETEASDANSDASLGASAENENTERSTAIADVTTDAANAMQESESMEAKTMAETETTTDNQQ